MNTIYMLIEKKRFSKYRNRKRFNNNYVKIIDDFILEID